MSGPTKATMGEWIALQEAIMALDGTTLQGATDKAERAKLGAGTRMYLKAIIGLLQPYMKAFTDEMQERLAEAGVKPGDVMSAGQQFAVQDAERDMRTVEVDISLPKTKHPVAELNLDENHVSAVNLLRLGMIFHFDDEPLVEGICSDPATVFKKPTRILKMAPSAG